MHSRTLPSRALGRSPLHALLVFVLAVAPAMVACSSSPKPQPTEAKAGKDSVAARKVDVAACEDICDASAACGDAEQKCHAKCVSWLVERSRPGIAESAAKCAVPRIDVACHQDAAKGAARALVLCVDEAGRKALRSDKSSLLVAARAICERGARCGGGTPKDASGCVDRIAGTSAAPRGLGIFGAVKPEHVQSFAECMQAAKCGPSAESTAACFGEMLGETSGGSDSGGEDYEPSEPGTPAPPPTSSPFPGASPGTDGTKI